MNKTICLTDSLKLTITDEASAEDRRIIHEAIKTFNNEVSPQHLAARQPGAVTFLNLFLRDNAGQVVGGLTAETFWQWLSIDDLWLSEGCRGRGFGRTLLMMAEAEALRRRCRWAKLATFSFQARGFYEKLGYRLVGELPNYPPGESLFWMCKDLVDGSA